MPTLFRSKTGLTDSTTTKVKPTTGKKTDVGGMLRRVTQKFGSDSDDDLAGKKPDKIKSIKKPADFDIDSTGPISGSGVEKKKKKKSATGGILRRVTQKFGSDSDDDLAGKKPDKIKSIKKPADFDTDSPAPISAIGADKKKKKGLFGTFTAKNGADPASMSAKSKKTTPIQDFEQDAEEEQEPETPQATDERMQREAREARKKAGGNKLLKKSQRGDEITSMGKKERLARYPQGVLDDEFSGEDESEEEEFPVVQKYNKKTGTHSNVKTEGKMADAKFVYARATGQASKKTERVHGRKGARMQIDSDEEE
ncbi:uncharacterized protein HMPREF1541_07299 [Cyphellophora europaea CBS 101466]|uniref:Uncharacterized protein n=1 Tax=Cyphellophora europaea (strain CBS 101466) TaxID=1220924 RepID=W2RMC7_CYPE1|nr:uncharacterized protein HMPREF1541_07299 [Cyphellophora europaea CBS 101466]ETN37676.1 hypothetical protein HMPREF1541_07299 [Cyphellophora europaea CBS 101466]